MYHILIIRLYSNIIDIVIILYFGCDIGYYCSDKIKFMFVVGNTNTHGKVENNTWNYENI